MISLVEWYNRNKRDLPWRETKNPYNIWLSEVIMQQTRVAQGLSYYIKFLEKYPNVESLASANSDEVFKLWEGLGYYSRARNLLKGARQIIDQFDGKFPETIESLKEIKGIGDYTAAAIASISFNIAVPVVDGNVYRVLSRLYALDVPIDSGAGKKIFFELAKKLLNNNIPGTHNQAIMELGALVCTPQKPNCSACPLSSKCLAFANGTVFSFPVKSKTIKKSTRYFYYYIIGDGENFLIHKRNKADIWHNLYEFPILESLERLSEKQIISGKFLNQLNTAQTKVVKISKEYKHVLTHQVIYARFIHLHVNDVAQFHHDGTFIISIDNISNYAMPRLITRYLENESV